MVRIKIGGTCDPLERLLMQLVQDWDELERWAFRYYSTDEKAKIAREMENRFMDGERDFSDAFEMVYDLLDEMDLQGKDMDAEMIEANRERLEKAYYDLQKLTLKAGFDSYYEILKAWLAYEAELIDLGILESDEEPEEEEELDYTNDAQHWDEWVADQRYDEYRDMALMGYEY